MPKISLLAVSIAALLALPTVSAPLLQDKPLTASSDFYKANSWLEINVTTLNNNIEKFKSHLNPHTKICAVMKADAYGNGIWALMPIILAHDIPCVAIASNAEAEVVRASGFKGQLIRVRSASFVEIENALEYQVEELIGSLEQADNIAQIAQKHSQPIRVHLALNSGGMGRNGLEMGNDIGKQKALSIAQTEGVEIVGMMTHFPNYKADDIRKKMVNFQKSTTWLIDNAQLDRDKVTLHVANSYASLHVPEAQLDMVRPGGVLYGDLPTNPEYPSIVSFKSRVASLHHLPAGSTVGYDSTYILKRDSILANIPVGYSDGYPRKMGNQSDVLIANQRAPVVGVASMNTTMVDVTDVKGVQPGDEVVLFGGQGKERIEIADLEDHSGVIFPELYTVWGATNPRFYTK
ncbi:alanine racemase [Vibrio sp. Of7-15]|uniref:alanine racemase n=1 Tax=Vibrio sp. Of7-15 TaxID=2724879 RepID=UPI001EF37E5C|nr:alanine racemase [Vibrio sp. Of7-15]MCG7496519.1 alanine racemase [Vibrio sp. Of7-15]